MGRTSGDMRVQYTTFEINFRPNNQELSFADFDCNWIPLRPH